MIKVLITTMGDDRYTQLHMLKVLITTMWDDRYTQLHMLKVLITTMGDDRYTQIMERKSIAVASVWLFQLHMLKDHKGYGSAARYEPQALQYRIDWEICIGYGM
jgi:hypothetical protein